MSAEVSGGGTGKDVTTIGAVAVAALVAVLCLALLLLVLRSRRRRRLKVDNIVVAKLAEEPFQHTPTAVMPEDDGDEKLLLAELVVVEHADAAEYVVVPPPPLLHAASIRIVPMARRAQDLPSPTSPVALPALAAPFIPSASPDPIAPPVAVVADVPGPVTAEAAANPLPPPIRELRQLSEAAAAVAARAVDNWHHVASAQYMQRLAHSEWTAASLPVPAPAPYAVHNTFDAQAYGYSYTHTPPSPPSALGALYRQPLPWAHAEWGRSDIAPVESRWVSRMAPRRAAPVRKRPPVELAEPRWNPTGVARARSLLVPGLAKRLRRPREALGGRKEAADAASVQGSPVVADSRDAEMSPTKDGPAWETGVAGTIDDPGARGAASPYNRYRATSPPVPETQWPDAAEKSDAQWHGAPSPYVWGGSDGGVNTVEAEGGSPWASPSGWTPPAPRLLRRLRHAPHAAPHSYGSPPWPVNAASASSPSSPSMPHSPSRHHEDGQERGGSLFDGDDSAHGWHRQRHWAEQQQRHARLWASEVSDVPGSRGGAGSPAQQRMRAPPSLPPPEAWAHGTAAVRGPDSRHEPPRRSQSTRHIRRLEPLRLVPDGALQPGSRTGAGTPAGPAFPSHMPSRGSPESSVPVLRRAASQVLLRPDAY